MDNLTIVIPYYQERAALDRLLASLPTSIPTIVVDDLSAEALPAITRPNTLTLRMTRKGYFTGAVNVGIAACKTDVLVLNQDITLSGTAWLDLIDQHRAKYALLGESIKGQHPAFPYGYVHGVFQFMRRDALDKVGLMDAEHYPLWGASALWQLAICRQGFQSKPLAAIPGLWHEPRERYGASIVSILQQEPTLKSKLIRTPPLISVVIPCHNHGHYLADALNSLIGGPTSLGVLPGQTLQSFEVIVVDDGSNPKTREQCEALADGWKGIRLIRQENKGTAGANNTGIRASAGQYITIMAADDMREPWSLEALYEAAVAHPDNSVYDEPTTFASGLRGKRLALNPYNCRTLPQRNMVPAGIMFPKRAWQDAGGYREMMQFGREDWAFNIALALAGWHGHKIERSGYLYRREGQNRSLGSEDLREFYLLQLARLFPNLYQGGGMCCTDMRGELGKGAGAPARQTFDPSAIPDDMVLVEYVGTNIGSQSWGGPGTVPSRRYYVFGDNPKDKVKFVDKRDVDWLINRMESSKRVFRLYALPPQVSDVAQVSEPVIPPMGALDPALNLETPAEPVAEAPGAETVLVVEAPKAESTRRVPKPSKGKASHARK